MVLFSVIVPSFILNVPFLYANTAAIDSRVVGDRSAVHFKCCFLIDINTAFVAAVTQISAIFIAAAAKPFSGFFP